MTRFGACSFNVFLWCVEARSKRAALPMFPVPRQGGICFFVSRSLLRAAALPHATATRAGSSPSKDAVADHPRRQALCGQRASKEGGRARCYIHSSPGCWRSHTPGCTMKRSNGGSSAGGSPSKKR